MSRVLLVTGTDTGVGKTVVTAALAAGFAAGGARVAVYKPTQAGLEDGLGDVDRVRALAGIDAVSEGIRLPHPMAPVAAAERAGLRLPDADVHRARISRLAEAHDVVLVEGAGGLLVELDHEGRVLPDLAPADLPSAAVVVCRSGLGTLNHTALTLEALRHRELPVAGVVIGSWPRTPDAVEESNRVRLAPVGALPEGAGALAPAAFRSAAPGWVRALTGLDTALRPGR